MMWNDKGNILIDTILIASLRFNTLVTIPGNIHHRLWHNNDSVELDSI